VHFSDLDRDVRGRLRTLSKENAEQVGRHLVMTGRLLDTDPELAYEHAQAAVRRAGRVDVVREAAGLAAYRTGRFAEALRELRTVRRLNGSSEHLAIMADCERGLGRPERAIALAASDEAESLEAHDQVELAMVVSGARLDLGEPEAALAVLSAGAASRVGTKDGLLAVRVAHAKAAALEALGRADEAADVLAGWSEAELAEAAGEVDEPVVVWDLAEDEDEHDDEGAPVEPDDGGAAHTDGGSEAEDAASNGVAVDAYEEVIRHTVIDADTDADGDAETDADAEHDAEQDVDVDVDGDGDERIADVAGTGTGGDAPEASPDAGPEADTAASDTEERA
jgi:hypothetical protein